MSQRNDDFSSTDPVGFLITWTTYGTWLPGDERGWVLFNQGWQPPDPIRELEARMWCSEDACILDPEQRAVVEQCVRDHCRIRRWVLHAVNCRTNHCHAVITAPVHPDVIRAQIKAWATRMLKALEQSRQARLPIERRRAVRQNWWADCGSSRWIFNETSLEAAILYVRDAQDRPRPGNPNPPREQGREDSTPPGAARGGSVPQWSRTGASPDRSSSLARRVTTIQEVRPPP